MTQRIKILVSAHDVGSALQNRAFMDYCFKENAPVDFSVLANETTAGIFGEANIDAKLIETTTDNKNNTYLQVRQQFDRVKPKYALVGLSVFEGNIDEITNAVAKKRGIRAGVIQDYWGYLGNFKEGNMPDDIFVIDTLAHELTGKKIEDRSKIIITGSPKHVMYNPEICKQEKKAILKNAILKNEPKEIVYFGQPYAMPGIYDNLRYFVQALNGISQPIRVRLKIHPLDKGREEEYVALFKTQPHPFQLIPVEKRAESCLLEADLVVTCFSTVGLDHNYLQSQSTQPLGNLLYLMVGENIQNYLKNQTGLEKIPGVTEGMGQMVEYQEDIQPQIERGLLDEQLKETYHRQAKKTLGISKAPCNIILSHIQSVTIVDN